MKTAFFILGLLGAVLVPDDKPQLKITSSATIDSLGACQGAAYVGGKVYLYGDRETGMIREYAMKDGSLHYSGKEIKLTVGGNDVVNHPTGLAYQPGKPVFIGNSIRLNTEGTSWKAIIYHIDWEGLKRKATLDGNLIRTIEDDACIQGTRPEYVRYQGKWFVASADYGDKKNEVRLYDPEALTKADKTSEKEVLFKKFNCGAWVQNLHWIEEKGILVLIQNQIEGRKWRFTFLDLEKSVRTGEQQVIRTVDIDKADELEGFTFAADKTRGIAVTSSRKENVHFVEVNW